MIMGKRNGIWWNKMMLFSNEYRWDSIRICLLDLNKSLLEGLWEEYKKNLLGIVVLEVRQKWLVRNEGYVRDA